MVPVAPAGYDDLVPRVALVGLTLADGALSRFFMLAPSVTGAGVTTCYATIDVIVKG